MDLGLEGRKAIISGASKGLGLAAAMSLAREGVDVTILSRTKDSIEAAAEAVTKATGRKATAVAGDFNKAEDRERLLAACPEPDIVVNNPGVRQTPTPCDQISEEEWLKWLNDHFLS